MLAAVCDGPGRFEVRQVDDPTPGAGEALVRVTACGVCGTDLHIADGTYHADYPLVPGHELSGVVEQVGAEVAGLEPGTPIAMNPNLSCRRCRQCHRGKPHLCESPQAVGVTRDGGFAEFVVIPAELALPLPEGLPVATAALMEPLSCCLHGIDVAAPRTGDRGIILGVGTIGLLMTQLVRLHGAAHVAVSDPVASKRELALRLGADYAADPTTADDLRDALGGPADLVIEASGSEAAARSALDLVDVGGTLLFFGVCDERVEVTLRPRKIFREEITIRGAYTNPFTDERALALLAGDAVEVDEITSDRFPLAQATDAMTCARESESLKVVIEP